MIFINSSNEARTLSEPVSVYFLSSQFSMPGKGLVNLKTEFSDSNPYSYNLSPPLKSRNLNSSLRSLSAVFFRLTFSTLATHSTMRRRKVFFLVSGVIAPSKIDRESSKTTRSSSKVLVSPRPLQRGQAPSGELKEKRRGSRSG